MEGQMKSDTCDLLIDNGAIVTPTGCLDGGFVAVSQGKIVDVGGSSRERPTALETLSLDGDYVFPGFVDLHVNGGGGMDITASSVEAIRAMCQGHAACGTTGLLVAITGPTLENAVAGLEATSSFIDGSKLGSCVLGVQMEGPFVTKGKGGPVFRSYPGAQSPDLEVVRDLVSASNSHLKIVNFAAELPGGSKIVEYLRAEGIAVSIGHSDATYEEACRAIDAGVNYCSHLFNAMTGFSHRDPGIVGAVLNNSHRVCAEIITDGHHVHPGAIALAMNVLQENLIIATDATEAVGSDIDHFILPIGDGFRVEIRDGRTWGPDGQLIGSVLRMDTAAKNMSEWFGVDNSAIAFMTSYRPAKVLGLESEIGSIEVGKRADFAVLNKRYEAHKTIKSGETIWSL